MRSHPTRDRLDDMAPKQVLGTVLDVSRLFDLLRGSIQCIDFTQLVAVLDLLQLLDVELGNPAKAKSMGLDLERFAIRLHRFKCRFSTPTSGGWARRADQLLLCERPESARG